MRRIPILLLLAFAAACDRPTDPLGPGAEPSRPSFSITEVSQDETPDQMAVARVVPGFGGYFIDEAGAPTVYLTDPGRRPEAEQALAGFLDSFGWTAADLKVRQAEYDYLQLDAWYRQAWPEALAVTGAVFSDLDEASNRLRFGGVDAAAVSSIVGTLAGLNIPGAATLVEVSGPVEQVASLRDRIRPAHGGVQLNFFATSVSPVGYLCTLGFNAVKDGRSSFITNSHCTNVQGGVETPTDYYQATRGLVANPDNHIAVEVDDPHYWISLDCPAARQCRYSDAARAEYLEGQEFTLGRVARTLTLNGTTHGDDDPGILQIDAADPAYNLASEQANPVVGQTLNKVGRTTGWTQGQVASTCVNVNISASNITQLCQSRVKAFVAGGDSGSPVFGLHTDGSAFLAGILWGSSTNTLTGEVQFIFSPLSAVERELGELTTFDPATVTKKKRKKQR